MRYREIQREILRREVGTDREEKRQRRRGRGRGREGRERDDEE